MTAVGAQSGHPKHRLRPVRDALWPAQWIAAVFPRPSVPAIATMGVRCPNERNPIFFMQAIYGCPEWFAMPMCRMVKSVYHPFESA
jgi:hypothetical protein